MRMIAVVFVVACGGGSKPEATMPAAKRDDPNCSGASDGMVAMMMQGKEGKGNADATADEFRILIRKRCEQDGWSTDARRCLSAMQTRSDAEQCATLLTDEQQANLVRDQKAKFGAPEAPKEQERSRKTSDPCKGDE